MLHVYYCYSTLKEQFNILANLLIHFLVELEDKIDTRHDTIYSIDDDNIRLHT